MVDLGLEGGDVNIEFEERCPGGGGLPDGGDEEAGGTYDGEAVGSDVEESELAEEGLAADLHCGPELCRVRFVGDESLCRREQRFELCCKHSEIVRVDEMSGSAFRQALTEPVPRRIVQGPYPAKHSGWIQVGEAHHVVPEKYVSERSPGPCELLFGIALVPVGVPHRSERGLLNLPCFAVRDRVVMTSHDTVSVLPFGLVRRRLRPADNDSRGIDLGAQGADLLEYGFAHPADLRI